jgi:hypothetical protein
MLVGGICFNDDWRFKFVCSSPSSRRQPYLANYLAPLSRKQHHAGTAARRGLLLKNPGISTMAKLTFSTCFINRWGRGGSRMRRSLCRQLASNRSINAGAAPDEKELMPDEQSVGASISN